MKADPSLKMRRFRKAAAATVLAVATVLGGCAASSTGEIDNPVLRRATWVDFISAGDVRAGCQPGKPDRVRFVLNANRAEQVRIYDLSLADNSLRIRVLTPKQPINEIRLDSSITRFFNPEDTTVRLSEQDAAAILSAYLQDRTTPRSETPTDLLSEWHFWLAGACHDGVFEFDAWVNPDADFQALAFPNTLFRRDVTNIQVNAPPAGPRLTVRDYNPERQQGYDHYFLHLREDRVILGQPYGQDKTR